MADTRYAFLVESFRTERLKTLGVWRQVPDARLQFRPEHRARTALEHMVHQCLSEDNWFRSMLGIPVDRDPLPAAETREAFLQHYADCSASRLQALEQQAPQWFEEETPFFDVRRSRAWVLTRRIAHTAHHRGQLTAYLRAWGQPLYSTYGPTADTGGLPKHGARVIYADEPAPALPGPPAQPVTERPDASSGSAIAMQPIAFARSPYADTAQVPKGKGAEHHAEGTIEVLPQYAEGLKDIDGFSHLYVLWAFDRAQGYELLATPPTDTRPHGVFATRSPRRPNPIALTVVTLLRREGARLFVRGLDMLDGTPVLDIKPYLSSVAEKDLRRGWLDEVG